MTLDWLKWIGPPCSSGQENSQFSRTPINILHLHLGSMPLDSLEFLKVPKSNHCLILTLGFLLELFPIFQLNWTVQKNCFWTFFCDKIYSLVLCIIHYTLFLWNLQQRSFTMFSWENYCSGVIAQQIKVATQSYCTTVVTAALPRKLETSWKIRTISNSFKVAPSAALLCNCIFNFLIMS